MTAGDDRHDFGRPGWIDLASPDPDAARTFYCQLFGWQVYTLVVPGYGDYDVFTLGDLDGPEIGGMQKLADDTQRPSWTCYFRVQDLSAVTAVVKAERGKELIPPADYAGIGAVALCMDPQGADFGITLPSDVLRFGAMNEPSTLCWVELACRDIEGARRFYGSVFGWHFEELDYFGAPYINFRAGETPIGGIVGMDGRWPPHYPPHWIPYIWVEDCDAVAVKAAELGARIRIPPTDINPGRYSMMTDPTGARLAVITPNLP